MRYYFTPDFFLQTRILAHYTARILALGDSGLVINTGSGDRKFKILFERPNAIMIGVDNDIINIVNGS